jgi:quercetin dioxygenase-like cupin family protein
MISRGEEDDSRGQLLPNHPALAIEIILSVVASGAGRRQTTSNQVGTRKMSANQAWNIAGVKVQVLVSSRDTAGRYTICDVKTTGITGLPLHAHSYEDGFFYILEGDFQFQVRGETIHKPAGSSLFIPRQTAYTFRGNGAGGRFLVFAHPGGLDLFFQDVHTALRGETPTLAGIAPLLEKHGIVLFPNLEPE